MVNGLTIINWGYLIKSIGPRNWRRVNSLEDHTRSKFEFDSWNQAILTSHGQQFIIATYGTGV